MPSKIRDDPLAGKRAGDGTPPYPGATSEAAGRLVTHREATDLLDEETLRRVLAIGRHYDTGGRHPRPFWFAEDFEDCLGLAEIEANRGGVSP